MKYDKILVSDQVRNKLFDLTLTSFITEAFIRSLPFDTSDIATESKNLINYSKSVVNAMQPSKLLKEALEASSNNINTNVFLKDLSKIVSEIAEEGTARIMTEAVSSEMSATDIVNKASLEPIDTNKLLEASKKAGIPAVAEIVKDKVIQTIKDEKIVMIIHKK
jgi:hypothetical protein